MVSYIPKDKPKSGGTDFTTLFKRMGGAGGGPDGGLDNNLIQLLQQMQAGGGGGGMQTAMRDFLGNFQGSEDHMRGQMQSMAPFLATMLFQSQPYKRLQDVDSLDNTMQQYGPMAGKIAAQGAAGLRQAGGVAARQGLGRSATQSALAAQTQLGVGSAQADLYSQLHQQSMQNRVNNLRFAHQMDQDIARLAIGSMPAPRVKQKRSMLGPIAGALGTAVGGFLGGPLGAGLLGGAAGGFGDSAMRRGGGYGQGPPMPPGMGRRY